MISLRLATPGDIHRIGTLLTELDRYYGATDDQPVIGRLPVIRDALFGNPPSAHALLAWEDERLIGMASYSFLWPAAGVTRSLYLKELFVTETVRQQGVGHRLISELCRIALDSGCRRVEWTADTDNSIAQRFYATLGVPPVSSKLFYRLSDDALAEMAAT